MHIAEADAGSVAACADVEVGAGPTVDGRMGEDLRVRAVELVAAKAERD